ncbi:MAG: hypothetical protein ACREQ9_21775, partial [Candidatus Binatia bacterium]
AVFAAGALPRRHRWLVAWRGAAAALLLAVVAATLLLAFQYRVTGDPRVAGHQAGMGSWGRFGFEEIGVHHRHTPERGLEMSLLRLRVLNERLLGWPLPSLFLALVPFFAGRARGDDLWMIAPMLALLGTYAAFWYYEAEFPARYLFCGLPPLLVLSARGLGCLRELVPGPRGRTLVSGGAFGAIVFSVFVTTPYLLRGYTQNFGDVEDVLPRVVKDYGIRNAVVFMDVVGETDDGGVLRNDLYATGFLRNRLDLGGEVVYARNLRRRNAVLMRHYPDRDHYLYRFHRRTGRALLYRLVREGDDISVSEVKAATPDLLHAGNAPEAGSPARESPARRRLVTQPPYDRVR